MKRILSIITFCILHFLSNAQTAFIKKVWINEPETPVNVVGLSQQPGSYLWLCSDAGVYRYNGRVFTKIKDSLKAAATCITATRNAVYVGYEDGTIAQVTGEKISVVSFKNGIINSAVTSIKILFDDVLLIGTEANGLYISVNRNLIQINTSNGLPDDFISDIAVGEHKVLLTTDNGLSVLSINSDKINVKNYGDQGGLEDVVTTCIASAERRVFWIGTQQGGIAIFNDKRKDILPLKSTTPWGYGEVKDLFLKDSNHAWAITDNDFLLELIRRDDSVVILPKLLSVKLKKIVRDKADNLWCATSKGLLMITGLYAASIPLPRSYKLNSYTAMTCDSSGRLWFTQGNKLYNIQPYRDTIPSYTCSFPADITCLHVEDHKNIWVGTFGKGLYRYSTVQKQLQQIPISHTANEHILSITGRDKELWVASFNGIDVLSTGNSPTVIQHFNKHNGIGSDYIYHLHTDKLRRVWMATDGGGVVMYDGRQFQKWDSAHIKNSNVFYSITSDAFGQIWTSSLERGVARFNGKLWSFFNQQHGLQSNNITAIEANGRGMIMVNRNGIDQWYAGNQQFRHFNRRLNIGIDSVSKVLNCIAKDKAGNVYVPYQDGIILFYPQQNRTSIQPDIHIQKQSLFFKDLATMRDGFSDNENHIAFTYDGVSFSNPERLHFRYKLEGYDDTWVYTSDETVPFAQLNPGDYTFRVQASLSSDFVNAAEDRYSFSISKPFWQTLWFIITAALLILIILYAIVKLRERNIIRLNQLQRERLVYEYEHLKSQVNPHFLFNSFNTLVTIIEENKETAIDYTIHLSDFYRSMLSYRNKDLIPLKEEYEMIKSYVYILKSRFGNALHLHEHINPTILNEKKIVPFALQILLENAVKHNIVSESYPLHIHINAEADEITVRNNLQEKKVKEKHTGIGIENIKQRYFLLTKQGISYGIENNEYIVRLPLL